MIKKIVFDGAAETRHLGAKIFNCTDIPRFYWLIENENCHWKIGLNVNQKEIEPMISIRDGLVFVGIEDSVLVLKNEDGDLISSHETLAPFQWFELSAKEYIVVAAEDHIFCLNNEGKHIWGKNLPDIIGDTKIEGAVLIVTDISDCKYNIDLASGKSLKK